MRADGILTDCNILKPETYVHTASHCLGHEPSFGAAERSPSSGRPQFLPAVGLAKALEQRPWAVDSIQEKATIEQFFIKKSVIAVSNSKASSCYCFVLCQHVLCALEIML